MLSFLKRYSIKIQLMMLVICTVLTIIFLIIMTYSQISSVIEKNNNNYSGEIFSQIKRNISNNYDLLSTMLTNAAYSEVVQNYMMEKDEKLKYKDYKNVDSLLSTMQGIKSNEIIDFVILGDNGNNYFLHGANDSTMKFLKELPQDNMISYYTGKKKLEYYYVERDCFVIVSTVHSITWDNTLSKRIGIMAIVVDAKMFSFEGSKKVSESSTNFYLMDRENKVYSCSDVAMSVEVKDILRYSDVSSSGRKNIKFGKDIYVMNYENIPQTGGGIISIVPEKELFKELFGIRKLAFVLLAFALVLLSLPFAIIINNILQPLKKFMSFMNNLKTGNLKGLKERINLKGYSEIEIVSGEFNNMMDEIDGLTHRLVSTSTRLYEVELEKKQAELMYLRSQINPHFLYNTLESMVATAFEEKAERTTDMIESLADIFRYSVKGNDIVELQEELNIIKAYVHIQQVRFSKKLEVVYHFDETTLKCSIPKITLQPIVENAVFHGLETKRGQGHLWIGSKLDQDGNVCLWVNDDGVGMEKEKLENIRSSMENIENDKYYTKSSKRIGIVNVNNRIKLIYGLKYGMSIDSDPDTGTSISILIPLGGGENV